MKSKDYAGTVTKYSYDGMDRTVKKLGIFGLGSQVDKIQDAIKNGTPADIAVLLLIQPKTIRSMWKGKAGVPLQNWKMAMCFGRRMGRRRLLEMFR